MGPPPGGSSWTAGPAPVIDLEERLRPQEPPLEEPAPIARAGGSSWTAGSGRWRPTLPSTSPTGRAYLISAEEVADRAREREERFERLRERRLLAADDRNLGGAGSTGSGKGPAPAAEPPENLWAGYRGTVQDPTDAPTRPSVGAPRPPRSAFQGRGKGRSPRAGQQERPPWREEHGKKGGGYKGGKSSRGKGGGGQQGKW